MANLFHYLEEYGSASFRQLPFSDVDNLIFSQFIYSDLPMGEKSVPFAQVARGAKNDQAIDRRFLEALSRCERYEHVLLRDFVNELDPDECKQFAAVTALLPDGTAYLSFRGTDNTFVGWKEDFNLAFAAPVPAQREAVRYLESEARRADGLVRVGGHSKGGNLAVYAAAMCAPEVQERVLDIYNNDGPGHDEATVSSEGYQRVADRIRTLIPQSSIVGMLLEHSDDYEIVRSNSTGILQHSPFTWQVRGAQFERMDRRTWSSMRLDEAVRKWLGGMSMEKRRQFTDAFFSVLSSGDATNFAELLAGWRDAPRRIAENNRLDKDDAKLLVSLLAQFAEAAYQSYRQAALSNMDDMRGQIARLRDELVGQKPERDGRAGSEDER